MRPYQTKYIENAREILKLDDFFEVPVAVYEPWYEEQVHRAQRMRDLKRENMTLLSENLFPELEELHAASPDQIRDLEAFADVLMDWSTNLDPGVYVVIHDALLSLYRFKRDRNNIIKELYKLGMGLYYLNRSLNGIEKRWTAPFRFRNEMVFTEAGSYLKFFEQIEDKDTRGYIIRALANIAICAQDHKRRIAVSQQVLNIVRDDYYRQLQPDLPWDVFLRRTNQQMSANRDTLSRGNLTTQELAAVLESCYEVFKPEADNPDPNIRWLWPYYEMEYSCGFVDLQTTMERLERLIDQSPEDRYDTSSMYGSVQLSIYYGILMRRDESLQTKLRHTKFLTHAYAKMMRVLLSCPVDKIDDYTHYLICYVLTDYLEIDGVEPFAQIVPKLMRRFSGSMYVRSAQAADLMALLTGVIFDSDPAFFDDIPLLREANPESKRAAVTDFGAKCGLFHDLGLFKMNLLRIMRTRDLFEREDQMARLHTVAARDDLRRCPSTAPYADVVYGHHSWYSGAGGYPEDYVRNDNPCRQMTDVLSVVAYLLDHFQGDPEEVLDQVRTLARKRFSPLVTAYLEEAAVQQGVSRILTNEEPYYRRLYDGLTDRI